MLTRRTTLTQKCVTLRAQCLGFSTEKSGFNTDAGLTWKWCLILLLNQMKKKAFLTIMAEMLLAQLCKVCTEIWSLFTQPHCRTEIKHKTMPRHLGQFFLWEEAGHKWLLCLSLQLRRCRLTLAIDGQSSGQWKKWALRLATLGCNFYSSLPRLPTHTHTPPSFPLCHPSESYHRVGSHPAVHLLLYVKRNFLFFYFLQGDQTVGFF